MCNAHYERILFPDGTKNGLVIAPSGGGVVGNCNIPSICWKLMKITLMHLGAPSLNAIARLAVVASKNVSYLVIESTQSKNWQTARENWFPSKHPAGGVRLHSTLVPISHPGAWMAYYIIINPLDYSGYHFLRILKGGRWIRIVFLPAHLIIELFTTYNDECNLIWSSIGFLVSSFDAASSKEQKIGNIWHFLAVGCIFRGIL